MISKKKRIGFLIPTLGSGGAERVVTNLCNELSSYYDITLIMFFKNKPFYRLNDNITLVYIQDKPLKSNGLLNSLIGHYNIIKKIKNRIKENNIDLLIGFMTTANIYSIIISKWIGIPSIISERVHPKFSNINRFWTTIRKFLYPKADLIVLQTEAIKTYFKDFVKNNKLHIINNPISRDLALKKKSTTKKNVILNIGRLDHQKNQDLLIKAFNAIGNSDWELQIIGDGVNYDKYLTLIDSLKMKNNIKLLGRKTNVYDYYNSSKIFVLTSRYEGSPNALIEAMYFGLPCISTDCLSGPSELINDTVNGFLIPVGDQFLLEERLRSLMNDFHLRQKFSSSTVNAINEFNIEKVKDKWIALIDSLLN